MEVSSLWIGGNLPKLSILCIKSFLKNNYKYNLYTYENIENIPAGVQLKNAEEILPKSEIFTYRNGSVSAFSNLFRFTMIKKTGIPWVDTDMYCRKNFDFSKTDIVIVSEPDDEYQNQKPTSNLIKLPKEHPALDKAISICQSYREKIYSGDFKWGLGPLAIREIVKEFELEKFVKPWYFSNNCNNHHYQILYRNKMLKKYAKFVKQDKGIFTPDKAPEDNYFIHLWNEHFRYKKTPVTEMFDGKNMLTQMWNTVSKYPIPSPDANILITGGSGLVGSAVKLALQEFPNVKAPRSSELNILDYNQLDAYLKKNKIEVIIHLAANVGGLFKNMSKKVNMFEDNLIMNYNVLKAAHANNVKKVISCMSTCIFPDDVKYPINEKDLHLGPPHFSNDAYAYAKRMVDVHSRAYREQYGDNFVTIIPTNIYGPKDNYHLEDAHVIPALIHKCYLAKKNKTKFIVKGTGRPLRQFIYSQDMAELIKWVYMYYDDGEPIILSVSEKEEVSIGDVARMIAKEFDMEREMVFDSTGADGQYKKTADNTKLIKFLQENNIRFSWTSMEKGIKESVKFFTENYQHVRR